jgi:hypothetical protein
MTGDVRINYGLLRLNVGAFALAPMLVLHPSLNENRQSSLSRIVYSGSNVRHFACAGNTRVGRTLSKD